MDDLDQKIISKLKKEGRKPFTEIAEDLNITEGTVRNRVEKMQERGDINYFTLETPHSSSALVMVKLDSQRTVNNVIEEMPRNLEINEVTGEHDLIIKFERESMKQVNQVLDQIREIQGVKNTLTHTVLETTYT